MSRFLNSLICAVAAGTVFAAAVAFAQERVRPQLHTHQSYVEELQRMSAISICDPRAVFAIVLNALPERVHVYPTENYYYFRFLQDGTPYAGNIRIEIDENGNASLHFAYFETATDWRQETPGKHIVLRVADGVVLEKVDRLSYPGSYGGKSGTFAPHYLSKVRPP